MFNLHCTKKLLDRFPHELAPPAASATRLGDWYATALFWRPQLALMVNERTLLPVVLPLAPAATLTQRFPLAVANVLHSLGVARQVVDAEVQAMDEVVYARTVNRSVLGVMNQFVFIAEGYRDQLGLVDPLALSLKLAGTPCGPLYKGAVFPDKAVRELLRGSAPHSDLPATGVPG